MNALEGFEARMKKYFYSWDDTVCDPDPDPDYDPFTVCDPDPDPDPDPFLD